MLQEKYNFTNDQTNTVFEFISEGGKGRITKFIQYSPTPIKDIYNLGFGDKNEATGSIDDKAITNNQDSKKVLATVASTLYVFTNKYPQAWVYAVGVTASRTRLYQMGISNNLAEIEKDFIIYGLLGENWEIFEKDKNYQGFLAKRRF